MEEKKISRKGKLSTSEYEVKIKVFCHIERAKTKNNKFEDEDMRGKNL